MKALDALPPACRQFEKTKPYNTEHHTSKHQAAARSLVNNEAIESQYL